MTARIARCGGEVSIRKLCNRDKVGNRKNMICDSGMIGRGRQARVHCYTSNQRASQTCPERLGGDRKLSDVEGLRGYIYVHLQLEGGLTCQERDGGEEEIAN